MAIGLAAHVQRRYDAPVTDLPKTDQGGASPTVHDKQVHVRIPATWHTALQEAARETGVSLTGLTRMLYRQFLRGRYTDEERKALDEKREAPSADTGHGSG